MRRLAYVAAAAFWAGGLFGQTADTAPGFEIADVHVSPKALNMYLRTSPPRNGRYELKSATMVDLIRLAYGFDADKILGGPSWLEMNHYDVIAKVPAEATPETANPMLQTLLAERFKLKVRKDTKQLPTYALIVGKKLLVKEGDGTGDTGCRPRADSGPPSPGGGRLMMSGPDGKTVTINLGPGQTVEYQCRNVTMEAFTAALRSMVGASLGLNPILDRTGLKGTWTFDVKYSLGFVGMMTGNDDRVSMQEAIDKQLGLKLEEHPVPTPVLIVDSVEEKPGPNPPGVAEALPPLVPPTEFEVADIKLSDPGAMGGRFQAQPGGRFISTNLPLSFLVQRAFNVNGPDQIVGLPSAMDAARYDITAKTSASIGTNPDPETLAPLFISLLKERFGLKFHTEERPLPAYTLLSVKPKLKKADPTSRTHCTRSNGPAGSPPGTSLMTCQNISMAQFAEQLRGMVGNNTSVVPQDGTELEGGWDFTLTWNPRAGMMMPAPRPAEGAAGGEAPAAVASDPIGGLTIIEAVDKELGLKLEMQKRPVPVYVIDHLDAKPTDN